MDIKFWLTYYRELRGQGNYPHSDELREMLRRMGYEIKTLKDGGVEAIKR